MKVIEVKPVHGGWKVFEAPGVELVFPGENGRDYAIGYAKTRQGFSRGEIRVLDEHGAVLQTLSFNETERA